MSDQADKLRQLVGDVFPAAEPHGPLTPTIVVTGGKGGVGATTVALNLAVALSTSGNRTALVDAATHPDAAPLAGIDTSTGPCLADVMDGTASVADALRTGPGGLQILAGRWAAETNFRSMRSLDRLVGQLHSLRAATDILVVDSGSGMNPAAERFWQLPGIALLVTTPDDMSVMDAYATIKTGKQHAAATDVRVLVNQCDDTAKCDDVHRRIANACHRFLGISIGRAPRLPLHATHARACVGVPRGWDASNSRFARSVHQLSRFAVDALAQQRWNTGEIAADTAPAKEFARC